jgi:hypothetical protein
MKKNAVQQIEVKMDVGLVSNLEAGVAAWCAATHQFQNEPYKNHRDEYNAATDVLGQRLSMWQCEEPELAEQFGLWFMSHQEVWSV